MKDIGMKALLGLAIAGLIVGILLAMGCATTQDKINNKMEDILKDSQLRAIEKVKAEFAGANKEKENPEDIDTSKVIECSKAFPKRNPWLFPVTKELKGATITGNLLSYDCPDVVNWGGGNKNHQLFIIVEVDGKLYGATTEHGFKGQHYNRYKECFKPVRENGKRMFQGVLAEWDVSGEIYLGVCSRTTSERTNLIKLKLP